MAQDAVADQERVGDEEPEKNGQQDADRLLHAAHVHHQQHNDQHQLGSELEIACRGRQQAEQGIDATGNRYRDSEDIVDNQRRAGDQSRARADETARYAIPAAAGRKQLDDLVVRERNNEHRRRGRERHVEPEVGVLAQRLERLFRTVGRGGKSVCAQTDPGDKSRQRDVLARALT